VLVEKGRAVGWSRKRARRSRQLIVSNLNPKLLYTKLIDPAALSADFLRRISNWRSGSGTFRMNVALAELPDFPRSRHGARRAPHRDHRGPEPAYMDRAFLDARRNGWSKEPIVEMLIPRRSTTRLRRRKTRREPLLPACRAELPKDFPAAARGTTTARRSPT
jgi:phytoene dehydrogenase-like protein